MTAIDAIKNKTFIQFLEDILEESDQTFEELNSSI